MNWQEEYLNGKVLLIDKPLEWTSFDAVKKVRNLTRVSKVGHAGTLDPLATGLLIICTGKFTKKINEYMAQEKEYTGSFTVGAVTTTYDLESEPIEQRPFDHITMEQLRAATIPFTGEIMQVPPAHSAIKKDGVPVYKMARKGIEVKLEPRKLTMYTFEITAYDRLSFISGWFAQRARISEVWPMILAQVWAVVLISLRYAEQKLATSPLMMH